MWLPVKVPSPSLLTLDNRTVRFATAYCRTVTEHCRASLFLTVTEFDSTGTSTSIPLTFDQMLIVDQRSVFETIMRLHMSTIHFERASSSRPSYHIWMQDVRLIPALNWWYWYYPIPTVDLNNKRCVSELSVRVVRASPPLMLYLRTQNWSSTL